MERIERRAVHAAPAVPAPAEDSDEEIAARRSESDSSAVSSHADAERRLQLAQKRHEVAALELELMEARDVVERSSNRSRGSARGRVASGPLDAASSSLVPVGRAPPTPILEGDD